MSSDALAREAHPPSVAGSRPDEAFTALTADLGLPALWAPGPFAGFVSGGIALGNTFLETIRWAPGHTSRFRHDRGAICVALEPFDISRAVPELDRREIPH